MLPRLDALTVTPVSGVDRAGPLEGAADPRQQALSRSLQTLLGKTTQAQVLSRLTDGSFVVRVGASAARMQLPADVKVGGEVALTLIGLEPRPTFQLAGGGRTAALAYPEPAPALARPAGQPVAAGVPAHGAAELADQLARSETGLSLPAARTPPELPVAAGQAGAAMAGAAARPSSYAAVLLSKAPLTPADQFPPLDADTPPASLSPAGRMIGSVLSVAMQQPQATTVIGKLPLLPAPAAEPAALAAALHQAVGNSGLFYESHLAEWAAGARPLAALQREPQLQGAMIAAGAGPAAPGIADPATAQFIDLQLSAQEQGRIAWQGQLWPGQDLRWEISREQPRGGARQDGGEPAAPPWRSSVRFRFPLLGEIAATVVLAGEQLHIEVETGAGPVRDLLQARAGELSSALAAAGTPLATLTVRAAGADGDD